MPTLADLRRSSVPDSRLERPSPNESEMLISDCRSQVRSTDIIERKLRAALDMRNADSFAHLSTRP